MTEWNGKMNEWNGIKVGELYKRTGKGSRGWPLALVTEIQFLGPNTDCVMVRALQLGVIKSFGLQERDGKVMWRLTEPWPYKAVK